MRRGRVRGATPCGLRRPARCPIRRRRCRSACPCALRPDRARTPARLRACEPVPPARTDDTGFCIGAEIERELRVRRVPRAAGDADGPSIPSLAAKRGQAFRADSRPAPPKRHPRGTDRRLRAAAFGAEPVVCNRQAAEEFGGAPRQRIGRVAEPDAALPAAEQRPVADEAGGALANETVGVHAPAFAQCGKLGAPGRGIQVSGIGGKRGRKALCGRTPVAPGERAIGGFRASECRVHAVEPGCGHRRSGARRIRPVCVRRRSGACDHRFRTMLRRGMHRDEPSGERGSVGNGERHKRVYGGNGPGRSRLRCGSPAPRRKHRRIGHAGFIEAPDRPQGERDRKHGEGADGAHQSCATVSGNRCAVFSHTGAVFRIAPRT